MNNDQPVQPLVGAQEPQKKTNIVLICGIIFIVMLLCCICSAGSVYFLYSSAGKAVNTDVYKFVCTTDPADLQRVYNDSTTAAFRQAYSFSEYKKTISSISSSDCEKIKTSNVFEMLGNGWSVSSQTDTSGTSVKMDATLSSSKLSLETTSGKLNKLVVEKN